MLNCYTVNPAIVTKCFTVVLYIQLWLNTVFNCYTVNPAMVAKCFTVVLYIQLWLHTVFYFCAVYSEEKDVVELPDVSCV